MRKRRWILVAVVLVAGLGILLARVRVSLVSGRGEASPTLTSLFTTNPGDAAAFRRFIAEHPRSAHERNFLGMTPLMLAVYDTYTTPEIVQILLDAGADPLARSYDSNLGAGRTAIEMAASTGDQARFACLLAATPQEFRESEEARRLQEVVRTAVPSPPPEWR